MGKTADLAMVQKTIIDPLHKECKSQRVITERGSCSRSAVSKHIKCKVDWKEEMCTSNRDDRKLENTVKKSGFKHLGELHKEWTEAESVHHVRNILPGLWRKRTGLLLSGPKSSFQIKVHFAFHLEIKVPESGGRAERHRIHVAWSPVWSFHSQWWFGVQCHLLVLVHSVSEVHS